MKTKHRVRLTKTIIDKLPTPPVGSSKQFEWDEQVPGFGVYKTQSGHATFVYQYRMRVSGASRRVTLGRLGELTVDQARGLASGLAFKVRQNIDPILEAREQEEQKRGSDALLLRNFLPTFVGAKAFAGKPVAPDALRRFERNVLSELGDKHLEQITVDEVQALLVRLKEQSDSAARRAIEFLKAVMNYAKKTRRIVHAATDVIPTPISGKRERAFNSFEIARYVEALHDLNDHRGDALLVLFLLLRRRDEVAKMRWEEIDQKNWIWSLPSVRVKTGRAQILVLSRQVVSILERQQRDPSLRRGFVFGKTRHDDNKRASILKQPRLLDHIDAAVDRRLELHAAHTGVARAEFPHYTIHDGRTTAASMLQQKPLSVLPHIIEAALNHASQERGIKSVYQLHRYVDEVGEVLQQWADLIDSMMSEPDCWPGGKVLPKMTTDERERRAANMRLNWTGRTKVLKRSSEFASAKERVRSKSKP